MRISHNFYRDRKSTRSKKFIKLRNQYSKRTFLILSKYLNPNKKMKILDIGCDVGAFIIGLQNYLPNCSFIGIDVGFKAIKEAKKQVRKRGLKKVNFLRASATNLPFKNQSFDLVICEQVIEHVEDQEKLISEAFRVLKNGGIFFITTGNRIFPWEDHLNLPFIPWLPKSLAISLLSLISKKKSEYYKHVYPIDTFSLEWMLKKTGFKTKYTSHHLFDSEVLNVLPTTGRRKVFKFIAKFIQPFLGNSITKIFTINLLKIAFPYLSFICKK